LSISNLFNKVQSIIKNEIIFKEFYRGGMQINKNLIAFTSYYISRVGKDNILEYKKKASN
jgi:hypothetical protein